MTAATVLTMANGKGIDLLDPNPADIHWASIAEHLAKEKRFNGATPDTEYSVAQHSYLGADAILAAGGTELAAAYFLLHDGHEALIKDDTTPKKRALAILAEQHFGVLAAHIVSAFELLTYRQDVALHEAAGLQFPPAGKIQAEVKRFDLIMFVTEWRDLMFDIPHPNPAPYAGIKPLKQRIVPLEWGAARAGWMLRAARLLPVLRDLPKLAHGKSRSEQGGASA